MSKRNTFYLFNQGIPLNQNHFYGSCMGYGVILEIPNCNQHSICNMLLTKQLSYNEWNNSKSKYTQDWCIMNGAKKVLADSEFITSEGEIIPLDTTTYSFLSGVDGKVYKSCNNENPPEEFVQNFPMKNQGLSILVYTGGRIQDIDSFTTVGGYMWFTDKKAWQRLVQNIENPKWLEVYNNQNCYEVICGDTDNDNEGVNVCPKDCMD